MNKGHFRSPLSDCAIRQRWFDVQNESPGGVVLALARPGGRDDLLRYPWVGCQALGELVAWQFVTPNNRQHFQYRVRQNAIFAGARRVDVPLKIAETSSDHCPCGLSKFP